VNDAILLLPTIEMISAVGEIAAGLQMGSTIVAQMVRLVGLINSGVLTQNVCPATVAAKMAMGQLNQLRRLIDSHPTAQSTLRFPGVPATRLITMPTVREDYGMWVDH
jgi:hypothetical protein